jgi:hypothetical protein
MKSYKLSFTPAATDHIKDIALWYNKQLKGLGKRFKDNLKIELTQIKKNPFSRSFRYDEVRYAVVNKFPYAAQLMKKPVSLLSMLFSGLRKTRING